MMFAHFLLNKFVSYFFPEAPSHPPLTNQKMNWNGGRLTREEIIGAIKEKGYVVINDVLSPDECAQLLKLADEDLQYVTSQMMTIADPSEDGWDKSLRPIHRYGYIDSYGMTASPHVIMTRELVAKVWARMFPTDHIWTSFEGTSIDWKRKRVEYQDFDAWQWAEWYRDSIGVTEYNETTPYQSYVSLTNERSNHRVFMCVPKSHKRYAKVVKRQSEPIKGFQLLTDKAIKYLRDKKKMRRVRIPLPAGSMILFDSRLIHGTAGYCNPVEDNHVNVRVKVSMSPVPRMSEEALDKKIAERKAAFRTGTGTTNVQFPKLRRVRCLPRRYGRDSPHLKFIQPQQDMSHECAVLHGLVLPDPLHEVKRVRIT